MSKTRKELRSDGEATRQQILNTAGKLFAKTGYAETTSKAIATLAKVNQASINYHFGSRGGLYQAVLVEAHHRLIKLTDLRQLADTNLPPPQKLWVLMELLVQRATSGSRDWHLKVLMKEILSPTKHIQALLTNEALPKISFIKRILSEITGIAEDDPALTRCLLSVMGPCLMLLIGANGLPGPIQEILKMPQQDITRHLHTYAMAGLTAIGREQSSD